MPISGTGTERNTAVQSALLRHALGQIASMALCQVALEHRSTAERALANVAQPGGAYIDCIR